MNKCVVYCIVGPSNKFYIGSTNNLHAMFVIASINKNKFRFNYGRVINTERLEKLTIGLPKGKDGQPDWDLIEKLAATSEWTACINN